MTKYILIIILAIAVSGCATLTKPGGVLYRPGQERKLAKAVMLLEQGETSAAGELLTTLSAEPGVARVTDEALFRLSLLRLASGQEKNGMARARQDLERLRKDYPASSWTPLAASLIELLSATDEVRQQERKLKELNLSLTKEQKELKELNLSLTQENKDLRESIEKLKSLELELGKGSKKL